MLELRYNGCSYCLDSAISILRQIGLFKNRDFKVVFHDEHRSDKIYQVRPDYLEIFSGAIMYNPKTGHWIDFYTKDHTRTALDASTSDSRLKLSKVFNSLAEGA